jgi:3',5'-cyclic AMP phosphodiesterase CpdA
LQIVHVTDLHFCTVRSDKAALRRDARRLGLLVQRLIEGGGGFGWHEGTLEHDATAVRAFEAFLSNLRSGDTAWFGPDSPPTWLVDSGDATVFGDQSSMSEVHKRLEHWRDLLGASGMLSVYGNHDAWPGAHPAMHAGPGYSARAELQQTQIGEFPRWQAHSWQSPLVAAPPSGVSVELYALNSVLFGLWDSVRAVGAIDREEINALHAAIRARDEPERRALRILVTHHPVSYPYERGERRKFGLISQMELVNRDEVARTTSNDDEALAAPGQVPLIHLFLSGHTHLGLPGQALPRNVKEVIQPPLSGRQMQLVGGPLLLVRDRRQVLKEIGAQPVLKERKGFAQQYVFEANQQFQILRFYQDTDTPDGLWLERTVCARTPFGGGYRPIPELRSAAFMEVSPTFA